MGDNAEEGVLADAMGLGMKVAICRESLGRCRGRVWRGIGCEARSMVSVGSDDGGWVFVLRGSRDEGG